jgi:hypothetical protein
MPANRLERMRASHSVRFQFVTQRWLAPAAQPAPHGKLRRSAIFIALNIKKNGPKPRRGGTLSGDATYAAPPGLGKVIEGRGCYRYAAPPELGLASRVLVGRVRHPRRPAPPLQRTAEIIFRSLRLPQRPAAAKFDRWAKAL